MLNQVTGDILVPDPAPAELAPQVSPLGLDPLGVGTILRYELDRVVYHQYQITPVVPACLTSRLARLCFQHQAAL